MAKVEPRQIEGYMTVAALLERWPELAQAFRRRGMSCPGCVMSRFDALDHVARVYGLGRTRWLSELRSALRPGAGGVRRGHRKPHAPRRVSHGSD